MADNYRDSSTGSAVLAGAVGLVVGMLINPARKLAVQAPTMLKSTDWPEALATEHKMALGIIDLIEKTSQDDTKRRSLHLAQLKHAISKHAFQEENVVYAMMRKRNLLDSAKHLNEDHAEVKRLLFELTEMNKDDPQWIVKVATLRSALEEHMREEEDDLFPKLQNALTEDENAELAKAMNKEGLKLA